MISLKLEYDIIYFVIGRVFSQCIRIDTSSIFSSVTLVTRKSFPQR